MKPAFCITVPLFVLLNVFQEPENPAAQQQEAPDPTIAIREFDDEGVLSTRRVDPKRFKEGLSRRTYRMSDVFHESSFTDRNGCANLLWRPSPSFVETRARFENSALAEAIGLLMTRDLNDQHMGTVEFHSQSWVVVIWDTPQALAHIDDLFFFYEQRTPSKAGQGLNMGRVRQILEEAEDLSSNPDDRMSALVRVAAELKRLHRTY